MPQDDVLYPMLTVRESLVFAALLRLPKDMSHLQKIQRADTVLTDLGLDRSAHYLLYTQDGCNLITERLGTKLWDGSSSRQGETSYHHRS